MVDKVCMHCNVDFKIPNRRSELVKYCSRQCKAAAGWEEKKCDACGVVFKRKKSDTRDQDARCFCSKECTFSARKGSKHKPDPDGKCTLKCETCNESFEVVKSRSDKARFCSIKCKSSNESYRKNAAESQKGEKSWRWSGGKYLNHGGYISARIDGVGRPLEHRHVVFMRMLIDAPTHPFIVTVDGEKKLDPEVEVHHIDRDRSNNDFSNLLAVTKFAHSQIHHRNKKPSPWECWPPNPEIW